MAVDGGEVMVVVGGEVAAVDGAEMVAGGVMAEVGPVDFLGISEFVIGPSPYKFQHALHAWPWPVAPRQVGRSGETESP